MQPNAERTAAATAAATDNMIIPNQYIVVLKPTIDTKREAVATEVKSHGSHVFHNFGNIIKVLTNEIRSNGADIVQTFENTIKGFAIRVPK